MFDLDSAIEAWRRRMLAAGIDRPVRDELESHLREETERRMRAGASPAEAFQCAVSHLGRAESLRAEFDNAGCLTGIPLKTALWLLIGISFAVGAALLPRVWSGKLGLLLYAHILTLTAGYAAAFLTGGFGIVYVCWRWFGLLSPQRLCSLNRAVLVFTGVSGALTGAGLLLGFLWSGQNHGHYIVGDPREIGGIGEVLWLAAFWTIQRSRRAGSRITMLLSISGNLVVSVAWFGAGALTHGPRSFWLLNLLIGIHLLFLAGAIPARTTAPASA